MLGRGQPLYLILYGALIVFFVFFYTAVVFNPEDVADNLFNPDPYLQMGGDMVRIGGLKYAIDPTKEIGNRISGLELGGARNGGPGDPLHNGELVEGPGTGLTEPDDAPFLVVAGLENKKIGDD